MGSPGGTFKRKESRSWKDGSVGQVFVSTKTRVHTPSAHGNTRCRQTGHPWSILASWIDCTGKLWVQMRNPALIGKVGINQERLPVSTYDLCTHMFIHTFTGILANTYVHRAHMYACTHGAAPRRGFSGTLGCAFLRRAETFLTDPWLVLVGRLLYKPSSISLCLRCDPSSHTRSRHLPCVLHHSLCHAFLNFESSKTGSQIDLFAL